MSRHTCDSLNHKPPCCGGIGGGVGVRTLWAAKRGSVEGDVECPVAGVDSKVVPSRVRALDGCGSAAMVVVDSPASTADTVGVATTESSTGFNSEKSGAYRRGAGASVELPLLSCVYVAAVLCRGDGWAVTGGASPTLFSMCGAATAADAEALDSIHTWVKEKKRGCC
jgi:hypothetical protein